MEIILKGLITGLFLSFFIGATFFMLIETSITRGFRAALWFDLGVVISDAAIITVVYFFTSWINSTIIQNSFFNIAGGLVFMGFGVNYILSRHRNDSLMVAKSRNIRLFMNGFFINLMNPSVVIFWLSAMAITLSKFRLTGRETILYYGSALGVVAITDILKAYFAYKLSGLLNSRLLKRVYIISGLLMIGLGVYIIFN
ncbi:MAG: LysE family transporter [Bacteroidales bacterium]|nr:LysE family transporter [Bacteroidales bacterium]